MNQNDKRLYGRLEKLAKKQLESIDLQLEADGSRWSKICFVYRNNTIKKILQRLWISKQAQTAERAEKVIMHDLDQIQSDDAIWPGFTKVEIDYIRLVFHGMHDVLETEPEEKGEPDSMKEASPASVSVAMPALNK